MKRLALGTLLVSMLVGSVAMAGQGFRGNPNDRDTHSDNRGGRHNDNRHDNHDRRDPPRQNWNNDHGRNDGNRGNDHRDWNRGNDRHDGNRDNNRRDWNRGNDRHDWNRGNDRRDWNRDGRRYNYAPPRHSYSPPPRYRYAPPRNGFYRERFNYGVYHRPYGFYSHSWNRGERLPRAYYSSSYVVYDYGRYGLRHPPYGYNWVRVDSDVVLAAVATGVILDVVYNHFY